MKARSKDALPSEARSQPNSTRRQGPSLDEPCFILFHQHTDPRSKGGMESVGTRINGQHRAMRLHHIGFIVSDIQAGVHGFASSVGASWDARIFHDPLQKVRVTFLQTAYPGDAQIELVEPAAPDSPVLNFLKKGGGLHHLCYEVADLETHLGKVRKEGAMIVKAPLPAIAFENRRIAWVLTKHKLLMEFLEQSKA